MYLLSLTMATSNYSLSPKNNSLMEIFCCVDTSKTPDLILEKVVLKPMTILYIHDTSRMDKLSEVFGKDYGELFSFIGKNGLIPSKTMTFYYNYSDPIIMDIAVEVNRTVSISGNRIRSKVIDGGDAIVVHYIGPYEQMEKPYNLISQWFENNKNYQPKDLPFEVYLNDPGTIKNKNELRTDIYQFIK